MKYFFCLLAVAWGLAVQGQTPPPYPKIETRPTPKGGWKLPAPSAFAIPENNARAANNFLIDRIKKDDADLAALKALELRAFDDVTRKRAAQAVLDFEPTEPFLAFATFYNAPAELLDIWKGDFVFKLNHLHRQQTLVIPKNVPGTDGRLVYWDIRDCGWTIAARNAVFAREPFMIAGTLLGETAARMNSLLGVKNPPFNDKLKKFHCMGVVRADWFVRETGETLRSNSYYDLLFAPERFPDVKRAGVSDPYRVAEVFFPGVKPKKGKRTVTKEVTETKWQEYQHKQTGPIPGYGDKSYPPGRYEVPHEVKVLKQVEEEIDLPAVVLIPTGQRFLKGLGSANADGNAVVDFPVTEDDMEKAFGIDKVKDLQKVQALDLENGAVVEGYEAGGSVVARQNRLLLRLPGVTGQEAAYYWKTFDTGKTLAAKNYFQTLVFDFDFDAGEVIFSTPCGAQAYGLFNKAKARQEFVPEEFAIDRTDKYDHRVRNPGSCIVCHTSGINTPDNLVEKFFKEGGIFNTLSKDKQKKVETYFKNWEAKLKADQAAYANFVKRATGRTPAENAKSYASLREYYDNPVTLEVGAVELGITPAVLKAVAKKGAEARVVSLALNRPFPVPRTTWDNEVLPSLVLLMDVIRQVQEQVGQKVAPQKPPLTQLEVESIVEEVLRKFVDQRQQGKGMP